MVKQASNPANLESVLPRNLSPLLSFPEIEELLQTFKDPSFLSLNLRKRFRKINGALCQLITQAPTHSFLFCAVLNFFERVNDEKIFNDPLNFTSFEYWLNNFSELTEEENYSLRAKIVGKFIPREDYQVFFPIGMNRINRGTHYVAAHLSPDVDTFVASFWGWMDAFAARVGGGLHRWSIPGGPPDSPFTALFREMFNQKIFQHLPRTAPTIALSAIDLASQKSLRKEYGSTLINAIEHDSNNEEAVVLIDQEGHYLGDWRNSDAEPVRQIIILFKACLHWFENNFLSNLISSFAKKDLSADDLHTFHSAIFDIAIRDCGPVKEFNKKQKQDLHALLQVLGIKNGLEGTFKHLNEAFKLLSIFEMDNFQQEIEHLSSASIFDEKGQLIEDHTQLFCQMQKLIDHLDQAMLSLRTYIERLDVVLKIKYQVLGFPAVYVSLYSDVDEMRQKIKNYDYLTVVVSEPGGPLFPVGIITSRDLRENILGTISLRDFCNLEEAKIASYLEVISVIDHHKSSLHTLAVPTAIIGDAQSCNVLIAEQTFAINDKYSLGGMTIEQIDSQIQELSTNAQAPSEIRLLRRLLNKKSIAHFNTPFFTHPQREYCEYLCFLHAILDDTDLLTKVSHRDLECVAQLLNRLKSLSVEKETEIVHFDDIARDKNFIKSASKKILQQPDMYALYKKIYDLKESEIETNLHACIKGEYSTIFLDTKIQNGCSRVGQTKLFFQNFSFFQKHAEKIISLWLESAQEVFQVNPEIDLYIHMISTIASAEEVFKDRIGPYEHQDQLWVWTPPTSQAYSHLNSFLAGFQSKLNKLGKDIWLEFRGPESEQWTKIFESNFPNIPQKKFHQSTTYSMVILHFDASALNSRKSMITPFLPRLVS